MVGTVANIEGNSAIIATIIGVVSAFVTQGIITMAKHKFQKNEEELRIVRMELAKRMGKLGYNLYSMLACCDVYLKRCKDHPKNQNVQKGQEKEIGSSLKSWVGRIGKHCRDLSEVLNYLRYIFWDESMAVESAIRLLIKFSSWITHYRYRPDEGMVRLQIADELRKTIDKVVMQTFRTGTLPTSKMLQQVKELTKKLDDRKEAIPDDVVIAGIDFVIPPDIIVRCEEKLRIPSGDINTDKGRIKIYEELIRTLDEHV